MQIVLAISKNLVFFVLISIALFVVLMSIAFWDDSYELGGSRSDWERFLVLPIHLLFVC